MTKFYVSFFLAVFLVSISLKTSFADESGVASLFNTKNVPVKFGTMPPMRRAGWYASVHYFFANLRVPKVSNREAATMGIPVTNASFSERDPGVALAVGYALLDPSFRAEVAYQYYGNSRYNANPALVGGTRFLKSTLVTHTILLNIYYDAVFWSKVIYPYIVLSGGGADNITDSKSSVIATGATRNVKVNNFGFVWGGGAGIKWHVVDRFDIDLRYMYKNLGRIRWEGINMLNLNAKRSYTSEIFIGAGIHFG